MKSIYKYELSLQPTQIIEMPRRARFLSLQAQESNPVMWWQIDTENDIIPVNFSCYVTGQELQDFMGSYLGTAQIRGFVAHFYINSGGVN